MNVQATLGGNDVSAWIMDTERTEKLCSPGQTWTISLSRNCPYTILPWHRLVLHEEGTKVLTGYVSAVSDEVSKKPHIVADGIDTWKRATDYWITAEYETSGDDILGLIAHFLSMCGLDYSINGEWWIPMPDGLTIPIQPISEILSKLAAAVNLFYRIDEDGVVQVGDVINDGGSGPAITTGVNLLNFDLIESDYRARNKVIVWGPNDYAVVRMDVDWAVVDHTMVYANPYIPNANALANSFLQSLHTLEKVKTCEVLHDPDRRVGQKVSITAPTFTGDDICTTLHSRYSKSGKTMTAIHGERCAIFGGLDNTNQDGKDMMVATYECGVWRCKDIWAASPHWEPLNTGLAETNVVGGTDVGSSYRCEWLVWDPFRPLTTGFLLTATGIYRTGSFEPGFERWLPVLLNYNLGDEYQDTENKNWYISRLRTTVAREGAMYVLAHQPTDDGFRMYIGHTLNRFNDFRCGLYPYGIYYPPAPLPGQAGVSIYWSGFWGGSCNYGHQYYCTIPSWHREGGYVSKGGSGSLESWNYYDGFTVSGIQSYKASNGGPTTWDCKRYGGVMGHGYSEDGEVMYTPFLLSSSWQNFFCNGSGSPLEPSYNVSRPTDTADPDYNASTSWLKLGALHIPYRNSGVQPLKRWMSPGLWTGSASVDEHEYPTGPHGAITPPWGTDPGLCNSRHGCVETFTHNASKVFLWSGDKPAKFAISLTEGLSWEQKGSVPCYAGSFSGFPTKWGIMYVGRDPIKDPTNAGDTSLVFATRDSGETFIDVTGDLWTQTQAMNLRADGFGNPLGASGIVTVLPMWSH